MWTSFLSFPPFFTFFLVALFGSLSELDNLSSPISERSLLFSSMFASRRRLYSLFPGLAEVRITDVLVVSSSTVDRSQLFSLSPLFSSFSSASGVLANDPKLRLSQISGAGGFVSGKISLFINFRTNLQNAS